jgi:hypothetical protein
VETTGDSFGNVAEGQPAIAEDGNGNMVGYCTSPFFPSLSSPSLFTAHLPITHPFFRSDSYGHQDDHTTEGWSNQISRIYLNSMFEFNLDTKEVVNLTSYSSSAHTSNSSTVLTNPVSRADGSLT